MLLRTPPRAAENELSLVKRAVHDPQTVVALSLTARARAALAARLSPTDSSDAVTSALQKLGIDEVLTLDYCWGDLAHAEAAELLKRKQAGGALPMMIHTCPAWANEVRASKPHLADSFSGASLNAQRQGLAARAIASARMGVAPERVLHVTVVGCPARKQSLLSIGFDADICGGPEHVLTVRELVGWLVSEGAAQPAQSPHVPPHSGRLHDVLAHAALLANGAPPTGAYLTLTPSKRFSFAQEGEVELMGKTFRVAAVCGADNAFSLLKAAREGKCRYDMIEALACASCCN